MTNYTTSPDGGTTAESPQTDTPQEIYQVAAQYWPHFYEWPPKKSRNGVNQYWREIDVFVECDTPLSVHQAAKAQISERFNVERRRIEILAVVRVERNPRLDAQRGESEAG